MKIYQSWKRNAPSTIQGESITYTIIYSSQTKGEIDLQEEYLNRVIPKGSIDIIDTEKREEGRINNEGRMGY